MTQAKGPAVSSRAFGSPREPLGFSTNLFEKPPPQRPAVTIFNRREDDPQGVEQTVLQALAAVGASVDVQVDPLNDLEE